MDIFKLDLAEIADLATEIAIAGAINVATTSGDVFDHIVGVASVIYEAGVI